MASAFYTTAQQHQRHRISIEYFSTCKYNKSNNMVSYKELGLVNTREMFAKAIKGGGGGQPGFAQAGGKDKDGISAALEILRKSI